MRGFAVLIALCAVAALILCSPALAGEKQAKNDAAVQAAQKVVVQKTVEQPLAVKGVRCAGGVCQVAAVGVVKAKTITRGVAAVRPREFRPVVRLLWRPFRGCCG